MADVTSKGLFVSRDSSSTSVSSRAATSDFLKTGKHLVSGSTLMKGFDPSMLRYFEGDGPDVVDAVEPAELLDLFRDFEGEGVCG